MTLVQLWSFVFGMFPTWFQAAVLGLVALFVIIIVFKIVALVLDAIPFL